MAGPWCSLNEKVGFFVCKSKNVTEPSSYAVATKSPSKVENPKPFICTSPYCGLIENNS